MKKAATVIWTVLILTPLSLLISNQRVDEYPDPADIKKQVVFVLVRGIEEEGTKIVYAEVPELRLSGEENQGMPEAPDNMMELAIAFNLADIVVLESLRGSVQENIYVQNIFGFDEALFYQAFTWMPKSKWVLILESPFDSSHSEHKEFMEKLRELDAGSFLTPKNFYMLHHFGFGALCLQWPEGEEKGELLPVAGADFVEDLQLILKWRQEVMDTTKIAPEPLQVQQRLKNEFGKALFEQLIKTMGVK